MSPENADAASRTRTCVLVLGMHRSGTSAATRMINLIGAGLPTQLMAGRADNEAGHWEPDALVALNDDMLAEAGSAWRDWRKFDPAALGAERLAYYRAAIKDGIGEEFRDEPLFVLKDPRISRFAPFYLLCLRELGVAAKIVLIYRHPLEVAESLAARNQTPQGEAVLMWLRHSLDAERDTRGLDRIVVAYEKLMNDPGGVVERLQSLIGAAAPSLAPDPRAARASVRQDLRHHLSAGEAFAALRAGRNWAERAFDALAELENSDDNAAARADLDRIAEAFEDDCRLHGDGVASLIRDLGEVRRERDQWQGRADELAKTLAETIEEAKRRHISALASFRRADFDPTLPPGLSPWRSFDAAKREKKRRLRDDYLTLMASALFDAEWYREAYPDIVAAGFTPAMHYLQHGWREGRWPNASVDPVDMRALFPELGPDENPVLKLIAGRQSRRRAT